MKKLILGLLLISMFSTVAFARVYYVKSYVRTDGTLVQGHLKTTPNSTTYDNYSNW